MLFKLILLILPTKTRYKQVKNLQNRETTTAKPRGQPSQNKEIKQGRTQRPPLLKIENEIINKIRTEGQPSQQKEKVMNTKQEKTPAQIYAEFGPVGVVFQWLDEHPRAASVLLWLQGLALAYVVFTYEFTIPAYK